MKILLVYHLRLGDVIRIFPIARHFAAQGHEVAIECLPVYHGIFGAIDYARPVEPGHGETFDRVDRLQIWPERYSAFLASGQTWMDFVYSLATDFAEIDRRIVFTRIDDQPSPADYGLPADYTLVVPFGYSQRTPRSFHETMGIARRENTDPSPYVIADPAQASLLTESGFAYSHIVTCREPAHLVRLLRDARAVTSINSAPCVICGAVRESFAHIIDFDAQNDYITPASRVVRY